MKGSKLHISHVFGTAGWICAILGIIAKAMDKAIGYDGNFWLILALFLVVFAICAKVEDIRSRG